MHRRLELLQSGLAAESCCGVGDYKLFSSGTHTILHTLNACQQYKLSGPISLIKPWVLKHSRGGLTLATLHGILECDALSIQVTHTACLHDIAQHYEVTACCPRVFVHVLMHFSLVSCSRRIHFSLPGAPNLSIFVTCSKSNNCP